MHRNYDLRQAARSLCLGQLGGKRIDTHVRGRVVDIDEIDVGTAIERAIGAGNKGNRAGPDKVSWSYAKRKTGDVQCARRTVDGDGVGGAAVLRYRLFKVRHGRTLGNEV